MKPFVVLVVGASPLCVLKLTASAQAAWVFMSYPEANRLPLPRCHLAVVFGPDGTGVLARVRSHPGVGRVYRLSGSSANTALAIVNRHREERRAHLRNPGAAGGQAPDDPGRPEEGA